MGVLRPSPSVRKLPDPTASADPGPASPLERDPRSPKGWKKRESDGVGLAIVAALERAAAAGDGPAKIVIGSPRNVHHASPPVAVSSPGAPSGCTNWACTDAACGGFFCGSPPSVGEEVGVFRAADFLSHCYLCRKRLHGKDIYMYRGEKAFCSIECRNQQIVSDEFQEKCGTEVLRPADVSSSPYTGGRLFFTGIAAA